MATIAGNPSRTLPRMGAMIRDYYGVTHLSHGNYIAMISGQGANLQEQLESSQ